MKQMPKAVFVMENGRYTEITNEEHCHRQAKDADYRKKHFIPVDDCLMEVTYEEYKSFYRDKEHREYMKKRDKQHGVMLFGNLTELLIAAEKEGISKEIEEKEYRENIQKLKELIQLLDKKDRSVINAIFFERLTERKLAERMGISQPVLHRKKVRILKKLKSIAELIYSFEELD